MREVLVRLTCFALCVMLISSGLAAEERVNGTNELSVPPMDFLDYPSDRPDWLKATNDERRIVVITDPCETREDAVQAMADLKQVGACKLLESFLGENYTPLDTGLLLTDSEINNLLVKQEYEGTLSVGGVESYECATELVITPDAEKAIIFSLRELAVADRVQRVVAVMSCLLVVLLVASTLANHQLRRVRQGSSL